MVLLALVALMPAAVSAADDYVIIDLGTLGGSYSYAMSINDSGQIAGDATTASHERHAVLWTVSGGMQDLGTLGGSDSEALGINELGQVVGRSKTVSGQLHAFLWTASGGMQDLGTLDGDDISEAWGINDSGQIVGSSGGHGVLWLPATPETLTQVLINEVADLNLQQGIDNTLDAKLDTALTVLDDVNGNNDVAAANALDAFINAVEAQRGKKITDAEADQLIAAALAIIDLLEG